MENYRSALALDKNAAPYHEVATPIIKGVFSNIPFQMSLARLFQNKNSTDFKIAIWCEGKQEPEESMMQLAQFSVKDISEPQILPTEQLTPTLTSFSNVVLKSLRDKRILKEGKAVRATLCICPTLWKDFEKDKDKDKDTYEYLIKKIKTLHRREGLSLMVQWIKEHGSYEEARAFEVSGSERTKYLKSQDENSVPQKKSLGVKDRKYFCLQWRRSDGAMTTQRLGTSLPNDFDLSQYTISPSAKRLLDLLQKKRK